MPDVINGLFEFLGSLFTFWNCWALYQDKGHRGVRVESVAFFGLWGFWNLYYYPFLGQWASFFGGISIVAGNTLWVCLACYYGKLPDDK